MQLCNFIRFTFSCFSVSSLRKSDKRLMKILKTIRQTMFAITLLKNENFVCTGDRHSYINIKTGIKKEIQVGIFGLSYSRMDQVKYAEESL